jgi:Zn-dependent alcohol dehydrogenase
MNAKALICDELQNFSIENVFLKDPAADQIAIRTSYSGVSIGTESALIRNKISWGPYPYVYGLYGHRGRRSHWY